MSLLVFSVDMLAIGIALLLGFIRGDISTQFEEYGLITWFSVLQLVIIAVLSWKVFKLRKIESEVGYRRGQRRPYILWAIVAFGFLFLAFDEGWTVHEILDNVILNFLKIESGPLTDRLDDILVGMYGMIGIGTLYYFREELKRWAPLLPYLVVGFVLLFAMVALDILTAGHDIIGDEKLHTWLSILEEVSKVFSEGVFMVGFFRCFQIIKKKAVSIA